MLGSLFATERRAIQATAWGSWGEDGSQTWAGSNVNNHSALQLLTVFGCVKYVADGISTLPLDTLRDDGEKIIEVPHPRWLLEPVSNLDPIGWLSQNLTSILLAGNTYLHMDFTDVGLTSLVPLDPGKVTVQRQRGRKVFLIGSEQFDSDRILHIPGIMFPGADEGLSPVEAARQTIGAGMSVEEFAARFFGQGAVLAGVIEDPGPLDPKKAKETARIWGRLHGGKSKAHLPGVLQGGASWKPTGVTNDQAQFLQSRAFTSGQIASFMFLIDPDELGIPTESKGHITYANLEQRNARKVQVTFLPWIIRLEKAFSALLPKPRYVKFNVNGLLRGDMKTRYESYALATGNAPWMAVNEVRDNEDLAGVTGGDVLPKSTAPVPAARSVERDEHGRILRVVG